MAAVQNRDDLAVQVRGLTKVFKDFWGRPKARAVNGIDFDIGPGQVFGLLGPNGSGKSTTVKLLLGLLYPTRGSIRVLGQSPRSVMAKRRIGYLPEETYLYRYLTAAETLDFFGALFRIPPGERRRRCDQLLDMVGLARSRNRAVGEFSKGMARRIGLAQALINDPDLVILDEPTSGLDPIGCREVKDVIRTLAARGKTVILSSHLLADVEDVCDEVVILYGGRIRARGGLKEILAVEDRTRITMPRLEGDVLQKVLDVLRAHVSDAGELEIDQPTMNLEDFFLEVVRKAKEASLDTAGVQSGGRVAAYLQGREGPAETAEEARERLLTALSREKSDAARPAEPEEQTDAGGAVAPVANIEPDTQRLEALTGDSSAPAARKPAAPPPSKGASGAASPAPEVSDRLRKLLEQDNGDTAKK
ncbi:MAG: ABC transporter ATP-binding protein [Kiritimatiellaeota bacterium]|nr:ABC transporter ATP-binding protein [Kiritimatiellota bacterium]